MSVQIGRTARGWLCTRAGAIRVDQAADRGEVAGLNLVTRPDPGDTPDDLMAGDDRVDGGHDAAPLVADQWRSEWQMPQNRISICTSCSVASRRVIVSDQRRCRTGSGVCLRLVHGSVLLEEKLTSVWCDEPDPAHD